LHISDPYIAASSFLNKTPAALKFFFAIIVIVAAVALPRTCWQGYAVITVLLVGILISSRLPIRMIIKRLLIFEPFVIVAAMLSIMQPSGRTIFLSLILKGTISLFAMVLLVASTRFLDLLSLLKRLRLPGILITNISLMYRYLFLLLSEAERMSKARSSREFKHERWRIWHSNATVIGHLFVRTAKRAERIYAAMSARGWRV
jgi:cobalt/nickel transport system permease protein